MLKFPIARDALRFEAPLIAATAAAIWAGWTAAGIGLFAIAVFVLYFFRDPERSIPADPSVIVSPADGTVVRIERDGALTHLSIFLSIFNVHINRAPMDGHLTEVEYRKGKFRAAFNDLASVENEQNTLTLEGDRIAIRFSQIAGIVARRIVCWKKAGDTVAKGERIGLIRFGSRVDISLPADVELYVAIGDKVAGGSSAIGVIKIAS